MSKTTEDLSARASRLPPAERLELVDRILDSLDETDPALDTLWAREAEDRLGAWRRGEIREIPLEDMLRRYGRA